MGAMEAEAQTVLAPEIPNVASVTTSASSALETGVAGNGQHITIISDALLYIKFGDSTVDDPDDTATSGNGRAFMIPANTEWHRYVKATQTHFKVKAGAAGKVRWYLSS